MVLSYARERSCAMNVELFKSSKTSAGQVHLRQLLEIIKVTSLGALQVSLGRTLPPSSEMAAVNCSTSSFSTGRWGGGGGGSHSEALWLTT